MDRRRGIRQRRNVQVSLEVVEYSLSLLHTSQTTTKKVCNPLVPFCLLLRKIISLLLYFLFFEYIYLVCRKFQ